MRFLVSVFLLLGVIGYANADAAYNTAEAEQVVASVSDMGDDLRADYDALIEKVRAINPKIVKKIEKQAKSDEAKISMLRSYLARETFEYYKNKFMSDLKQRSRETGRKIRHEDFDSKRKPKEGATIKYSEERYWLDRGELDEKKCRNERGFTLCTYPDGFEEFEVSIRKVNRLNSKKEERTGNASDMYSIRFHKDVPSENYHLDCDITLDYRSDMLEAENGELFGENVNLSVDCVMENFSEYHAWRNQEVADTIAGKHDVASVEKMADGSTRLNYRENPDGWDSDGVRTVNVMSVREKFNRQHNRYDDGN